MAKGDKKDAEQFFEEDEIEVPEFEFAEAEERKTREAEDKLLKPTKDIDAAMEKLMEKHKASVKAEQPPKADQKQADAQPENPENRDQAGPENAADNRGKRESELDRRERELRERRRQLEREEQEYLRQRNELNAQMENQKKKEQAQKDPVQKEKPAVGNEAKNKKRRENPFKGTVNAQPELDETLLDNQQKESRALRFLTRYSTRGARYGFSSPEFRQVKKRLYLLDHFMRTIAGRTKLTAEEMENYEYFTMAAYKATQIYEKKKDAEEKQLLARGKKPSQYEQKRRKAIKEIQRSISQMREDMYERDLNRRKEEMRKIARDKIQEMQDNLDDINYKSMKDDEIRQTLTGVVVNTLFYMNRMTGIEKNLKMKPGKSYKQVTENLSNEMKPTKMDLQNIEKNELTKMIVEEGMKAIKAGKKFTVNDIEKIQKEYIRKMGRKIARDRKRQESIKNLQRESQPELKPQKTNVL